MSRIARLGKVQKVLNSELEFSGKTISPRLRVAIAQEVRRKAPPSRNCAYREPAPAASSIPPQLVAIMFTPTPSLGRALRRLALTTKQAGKDYYKGTGTGSMGAHTKFGGYRIDWSKVRTYIVPDLADFHVCLSTNPLSITII